MRKKHRVKAITNAGIPDFILLHEDKPGASAAIVEVKTNWSYKEKHIRGALSSQTCHPDTGAITWGSNSIRNNIIRQVSIYVHYTGIQ